MIGARATGPSLWPSLMHTVRAARCGLCPIRYQLTRERLMAAAEGNVEAVAEELARIDPETVRRPS